MVQQPLPEQARPNILTDYVGQEHLVGSDGIIRKLLGKANETGYFPSLIFWGPPGSGKTTLARLITSSLDRPLYEFSAVNASIKDIERVIKENEALRNLNRADQPELAFSPNAVEKKVPVIFIDEIHRFNKAQQDALLPYVEKGSLILIGATTENPSFEVIGPLLSRCRVVVLNQLTAPDLTQIINRASKLVGVTLSRAALAFLIESANGDARVALNVLEIASHLSGTKKVELATVEQALQKRQLSFDLKGEEFYNTISALHKSIRGSDPDAALYYLARMLEAGQDPLYIARRVVRAAAEDVGVANSQALVVANAAFDACQKLGLPECNIPLAEAVVYLAKSPKSNAVYLAYGEAAADVQRYGNLPIPLSIRNAPTKLMKELGYGANYNYHHSPTGEKAEGEEYLPDQLKDRRYISKRWPRKPES